MIRMTICARKSTHAAPAAESGARTYLAALRLRCGRALTTAELRQAVSEGEGNPALMGLIRAAHQKDSAARDRLVAIEAEVAKARPLSEVLWDREAADARVDTPERKAALEARIDELVRRTGLAVASVSRKLLLLEIRGLVRKWSGMFYSR